MKKPKIFDTDLDSGRTSLADILKYNPQFTGVDCLLLNEAEVGKSVVIDGGLAGNATFTRIQ